MSEPSYPQDTPLKNTDFSFAAMSDPSPSQAPTPETDELFSALFGPEEDFTPNQRKVLHHARTLERQRDEARECCAELAKVLNNIVGDFQDSDDPAEHNGRPVAEFSLGDLRCALTALAAFAKLKEGK